MSSDQEKFARAVGYERGMLSKTLELHLSREGLERKAFLEALLLHARNLIDFLGERKKLAFRGFFMLRSEPERTSPREPEYFVEIGCPEGARGI